jgi:outer membrane protein assembly factor BamB
MTPSRRAFLAAAGSGSALLAGCSRFTSADADDPPEPREPPESGVDELPRPGSSVHGADGSWSSFGCNAANTRVVGDGEAPVEGVSERWRVEVSEIVQQEPIVADGRVYLHDEGGLHAFDADDGSELWAFEDAWSLPVVRNGVVYVSAREGVHALEADSGDEVWSRTLDRPGDLTAPATVTGRQLLCGVGERVVSLDPEDGSERWHRDVFGQVLGHFASFGGYWIAVVTEAGMVYVIGENGVANARIELSARPVGSPTADHDVVYVPCSDRTVYALSGDGESIGEIEWSAERRSTSTGLAVADGLVFGASGGVLEAVDAESGAQRWEFGIGEERRTAPVVGRETVFVGGDRLWALDPAPEGDPSDGPAVRFEREFDGGGVGPGPVLDDGVCYVVAAVGDGEFALLALE